MLVLGLVVRLGLGLRTEIKYFKTCAIYLNAIIKRYTNKAYRYLYFFTGPCVWHWAFAASKQITIYDIYMRSFISIPILNDKPVHHFYIHYNL